MLHPVFNKANDYDLDVEFKPSLAAFNYEQTYDLIWIYNGTTQAWFEIQKYEGVEDYVAIINDEGEEEVEHGVPVNYKGFFESIIDGIPILFDRYFPQNGIFPVDFISKVYKALKHLAHDFEIPSVPLYVNGRRTESQGTLLPISAFMEYTNLDLDIHPIRAEFTDKYTIRYNDHNEMSTIIYNVPSNEEDIYITFGVLMSDNNVDVAFKTVNFITQVIKPSTKTRNINLRCHYPIVNCSTIVYKKKEDGTFEEVTLFDNALNNASRSFLYKNLDTFLEDLVDEINYVYPAYNKGIDYSVTFDYRVDVKRPYEGIENPPSLNVSKVDPTITATLVDLPEWYKEKSILRLANNNKWSIKSQEPTKGNDIDYGNDLNVYIANENLNLIFGKIPLPHAYTPSPYRSMDSIFFVEADFSKEPLKIDKAPSINLYSRHYIYSHQFNQWTKGDLLRNKPLPFVNTEFITTAQGVGLPPKLEFKMMKYDGEGSLSVGDETVYYLPLSGSPFPCHPVSYSYSTYKEELHEISYMTEAVYKYSQSFSASTYMDTKNESLFSDFSFLEEMEISNILLDKYENLENFI